MLVCWAAFLATLGLMRPTGHQSDASCWALWFAAPLPCASRFLAARSPFNLLKIKRSKALYPMSNKVSTRSKRQTCYVTFRSLSPRGGPQFPHACNAGGALDNLTASRLQRSVGKTASRQPLFLSINPAEIQAHCNWISSPFSCVWHSLKSFNYLQAGPSCQ